VLDSEKRDEVKDDMAFLESRGVHYCACCDGCGVLGPLAETVSMAERYVVRDGWVMTRHLVEPGWDLRCLCCKPIASAVRDIQ
jgi:hypothetical protein